MEELEQISLTPELIEAEGYIVADTLAEAAAIETNGKRKIVIPMMGTIGMIGTHMVTTLARMRDYDTQVILVKESETEFTSRKHAYSRPDMSSVETLKLKAQEDFSHLDVNSYMWEGNKIGSSKHQCTRNPKPRKKNKKTHRAKKNKK